MELNNRKKLVLALVVAAAVLFATHSTQTDRKVFLDPQHSRLKAGETLAVLVDQDCLNGSNIVPSSIFAELTPRAAQSSVQTVRLILRRDATRQKLEAAAQKSPCVLLVGENRRANVSEGIDPLASQQTHLTASHIDALSDSLAGSLKKDVVLAVIDTGLDLGHPDLRQNLWVNVRESKGAPGVDDDGNGYIDDINGYDITSKLGDPSHKTVNDHGTHVAGLAAAASRNGIGGRGAMGKRVRIMALNVFGRNWGTDTVDIDTAIRYAADNGANVINLSAGGSGDSPTTAAAISYAIGRGVTVVTAAGNLKQDTGQDFYFPGSYAPQYPGLISVAAIDAATGALCDFSNYGAKTVKIAASGCDTRASSGGLVSTRAGAKYGQRRGTSMASPIVAAACAEIFGLIRDKEGRAPSPKRVEESLLGALATSPSLRDYVREGKAVDFGAVARGLQ